MPAILVLVIQTFHCRFLQRDACREARQLITWQLEPRS